MDKKELDKLFRAQLSEKILKPLKPLGFKRYKPKTVGRIVGDSIFQILEFQKDALGRAQFTVHVANRPLYIPDSIPGYLLEPGGRLGDFIVGHNKRWWSFENREEAEKSFTEVHLAILEYVLPWFEEMSTTGNMIQESRANKYGTPWRVSEERINYDLGFIHLRAKQYEKAIELLGCAEDAFREDRPDLPERGYIKNALEAITNGDSAVEAFLIECEKVTRSAWKLDK